MTAREKEEERSRFRHEMQSSDNTIKGLVGDKLAMEREIKQAVVKIREQQARYNRACEGLRRLKEE